MGQMPCVQQQQMDRGKPVSWMVSQDGSGQLNHRANSHADRNQFMEDRRVLLRFFCGQIFVFNSLVHTLYRIAPAFFPAPNLRAASLLLFLVFSLSLSLSLFFLTWPRMKSFFSVNPSSSLMDGRIYFLCSK